MTSIIFRKPFDKCAFIDMGHGKLDHNGKYTTAPSKEYCHPNEKFHNGGWFYEGVKNADYDLLVMEKLLRKGVHVVPVCHNWQDTNLNARTNIANMYHTTVQPGIYFSEHSNAIVGPAIPTNPNARGTCIFTSPGQTISDVYATEFVKRYKDTFKSDIEHKKLSFREDATDGDPDHEAKFHVLVYTQMPAVLIENLFFDNLADARVLFETAYMEEYAEMKADWIEWCLRRP